MQDIQAQMFEKARNYVGNTVLLQRGNISMKKAKAQSMFKKHIKSEGKAEQVRKVD